MPVLGNVFANKSKLNYLSVMSTSSPFIQLYPWTRGVGIGTKFSDPATAATAQSSTLRCGSKFSTSSNYFISTSSSSPFIQAYQVTNTGFGSRVSNPASAPSSAVAVNFTPSNKDVIVNKNNVPSAWPWTGSAFGTRYTDSTSTMTYGNTYGGGVSAVADDVFQGGSQSTTVMNAWAFTSGTGWGARYSTPAYLSTGTNYLGFSTNPSGTLLMTTGVSPRIQLINWNPGVGFGTQIATSGFNESNRGSFDQTGKFYLDVYSNIYAGVPSPYIFFGIYPVSTSGFGTRISGPSLTSSGGTHNFANGVFSPYGTEIVMSSTINNSIYAYPFNGSSIGTRYSDPANLPAGTVLDVQFG
jgi:hypothetical protein